MLGMMADPSQHLALVVVLAPPSSVAAAILCLSLLLGVAQDFIGFLCSGRLGRACRSGVRAQSRLL